MPLPTGGPWPPKPYDVALKAMHVWDSWYIGDTGALAMLYGSGNQSQTRPSQFSGGITGVVARMFWGRPGTIAQQRARMHMPVAADLCRTSAGLLFAAPPAFTSDDNDTAQARLDKIANTPMTHSALLEGAELGAALGGTYLRLVWDTDVADHVMLDVVDADRAIPDFRWNRLVAVTFWDKLDTPDGTSGNVVWWHLERHEPGVILHGLYKGTAEKLGSMQPLEDHPVTAGYAGLVDEQGGIPTGCKGLTAAYVPNVRPMPAWRKTNKLSDLGKPDLAGVEPQMDFIDETWSSLGRELRLAKARLIVPEYMLTNLGVGAGAGFDAEQEIFTPLSMPPADNAASTITAQQPAIRVVEHLAVIDAVFREVLHATGYSPLTFGLPDEVAATATEINAREKDSLKTRASKIRHWNAGLGPLSTTMLQVDAAVFGTGVTLSDDVDLVWPDGARDSLLVRSQSVAAMAQAQAASTETRVRLLNPDLKPAEVQAEADLIKAEQGMSVPSPFVGPAVP